MDNFITALRWVLGLLALYSLGAGYFKAVPGAAFEEESGVPQEGPTWRQHIVWMLVWLGTLGLSFLTPWAFILPLCMEILPLALVVMRGYLHGFRRGWRQARSRKEVADGEAPLRQLPLWPLPVLEALPVDLSPRRYWVGCRFCQSDVALTAKEIAEVRQALEDAGEEVDDPERIAVCDTCADMMGLPPTLTWVDDAERHARVTCVFCGTVRRAEVSRCPECDGHQALPGAHLLEMGRCSYCRLRRPLALPDCPHCGLTVPVSHED